MTGRTPLNANGRQSPWRATTRFVRGGGGSVLSHWALACFSVAAAFGVWFVVQDVENPQVDVWVPAQTDPASIVPQAVNAGDFIVSELAPIRVQVQARKSDVASLRPSDFDASVDVKGVQPGAAAELPVHVTSRRSGVRVVSVNPANVTVTLQQAKVKDVPVTINRRLPLPPGYQESSPATVDPVFVTVRGLPDLVDSVAEVDVDVNLSNVRGDTQIDGDLVARTSGGSTVTVTISPTSARVSLKVAPIFEQRTMGLTPTIVGVPAPGYRVGNVTIDPPVVTVTGPKDVVDGLQALGMDQVDVTGATKDVVQSRLVDRVPNLVADHTSVIVTVSIVPFDTAAAFIVAPDIRPPAGLTAGAGPYSVTVQVSGPLALMQVLKAGDIKASVSLTGALAGTATYPVTVTVPAGLKADPIDPISITLRAASP